MTRTHRLISLPIGIALAGATVVAAGGLPAPMLSDWAAYVSATETRMDRERGSERGYLAQDFGPTAAGDRRTLLGGGLVVHQVETTGARGEPLLVQGALVHHWRGAVLIPGQTVAGVLARAQRGVPDTRQQDVLDAAVLERGPDRMKVYLKLQRTKFVTVVYNTEHVVTFRRDGPMRASSASTATKIAELEAPGTSHERERAPGEDRGFLWRWNTYWRYEQVPGGVIAECESLSLSRDIPYLLRFLVTPLVEQTARESMARTLMGLRERWRVAGGG